MRRLLAIMLAGLLLGACASAPAGPLRRETVSSRIAEDAAAFNEAYGQAVSAQILLNILRARDRLPRFYLSMTGIAEAPSLRWQESAGVGSIPLGEGASPWGFGNFGLTRETISRPSYAVQPFNADTLTRTAFEPTEPYVFAHYWRSGWPRDLLLLTMVERIDKIDRSGATRTLVNEANVIFENCSESVATSGCAFVREVRVFLAAVADAAPERSADPHAEPVCGLVDSYGAVTPVRAAPPAPDQHCDPEFVVGSARLVMHLRSLDDIVYYVGELMRVGAMDEDAEAIEAQVTVNAAGLRGGGRGVPLFRITKAGEAAEGVYAARVAYGGERYGAPAEACSLACGDPNPVRRPHRRSRRGDRRTGGALARRGRRPGHAGRPRRRAHRSVRALSRRDPRHPQRPRFRRLWRKRGRPLDGLGQPQLSE